MVIWVRVDRRARRDGVRGWVAQRLDGDAYVVGDGGALDAIPESSDGDLGTIAAAAVALLVRGAAAHLGFALVACGDVAINGVPPLGGIALLRDRDEIRTAGGARLYYSTERLPAVEPYPGTGSAARCARCGDPLHAGESAVRCTGCHLWYHHGGELPCFDYAETCSACRAPTRLDGDFAWSPAEI